jgi:hypothetical protein
VGWSDGSFQGVGFDWPLGRTGVQPNTHFEATMKPTLKLMHHIQHKARGLRTEHDAELRRHATGGRGGDRPSEIEAVGIAEVVQALVATLTPVTEGIAGIRQDMLAEILALRGELREVQNSTAVMMRRIQ